MREIVVHSTSHQVWSIPASGNSAPASRPSFCRSPVWTFWSARHPPKSWSLAVPKMQRLDSDGLFILFSSHAKICKDVQLILRLILSWLRKLPKSFGLFDGLAPNAFTKAGGKARPGIQNEHLVHCIWYNPGTTSSKSSSVIGIWYCNVLHIGRASRSVSQCLAFCSVNFQWRPSTRLWRVRWGRTPNQSLMFLHKNISGLNSWQASRLSALFFLVYWNDCNGLKCS